MHEANNVYLHRFLTYNSILPCHALTAVRILHKISRSPVVQPKLVGLFTAPSSSLPNASVLAQALDYSSEELASRELLHGFVEGIDTEGPIEGEEDDEEVEEDAQGEEC